MSEKSSFTSQMGFVLATAGAAVGLGNIWRFPYLAAEYGGGIFLITYLCMIFTVGFILVLTESALGRKTGSGVICAFEKISRKWGWLGYLVAIVPLLILSFYAVVAGWVIHYMVMFFTGNGAEAAATGYFEAFTADPFLPAFWTVLFILGTAFIVIRGVSRGIERINRILMPVLLGLLAALALYCLTMPGGLDGLAYFLTPDFSQFSPDLVLAAMGQMFFTLMIGSGVIVTYGSYMSKKDNLVKSAHAVDFFDTAVALLAGVLVICAVFAFSGGSPETLGSGPALMFIALPAVFVTSPIATILGGGFFLLVLFAAITSSVSMYEVATASFIERFSLSRKKVVIGITIYAIISAIIVSLGYGVLDFIQINGMNILDMMDYLANNILLPLASLLMCIVAGWVIKPQGIIDEITEEGVSFRGQRLFSFMLRWVVPVVIAAILISGVL